MTFDQQIYYFFTTSVFNLQDFEAKNLSTNLQEFLEKLKNSTINIGKIYNQRLSAPFQPIYEDFRCGLQWNKEEGYKHNA